MSARYWQDMTTQDFAAVDPARTVAVLPVAAIEQHGPHLPLSTDAVINAAIIQATLERLPAAADVLMLPPQTVGDSLEHSAFPGTLRMEFDTLVTGWLSIGRGVADAGVRKLVIFNTHGGQKAHVDLAALRLRAACGMLVARAHSFSFGTPAGLFAAEELAHGLHGGAVETSLMLYLKPELVRRNKLADFSSRGRELAAKGGWLGVEKPIGLGWMAQDLHASGACGNALEGTREKGAALFEHLVDGLASLLAQVQDTAWPPPG